MSGLDLVHDVKHLLRGHAELCGRSVPLSVLARRVGHVPSEVPHY